MSQERDSSLPFAKHGMGDSPSIEDVLSVAREEWPDCEYFEIGPGLDSFLNFVWCVSVWKREQDKSDGYKPLHKKTYKNFEYVAK